MSRGKASESQSQIVMRLSKYTGEHLELGGGDISHGEDDQVFRLLFMVSPAIVLFMALGHLFINWTGLLYHIWVHFSTNTCQ